MDRNEGRESGDSRSVETLLTELSAARERAHSTGERAAQQFTKLLGTVHGGLGVAVAAWLQHIFEQSGPRLLSPLTWYLAIALFCVALGLITLVLAAIIDQRSANHAAQSINYDTQRVWLFRQRVQIAELGLKGDERSAKELFIAQEDATLRHNIAKEDARAKRTNAISEWVGLVSWVCLFAAFTVLGIGIITTINHFAC